MLSAKGKDKQNKSKDNDYINVGRDVWGVTINRVEIVGFNYELCPGRLRHLSGSGGDCRRVENLYLYLRTRGWIIVVEDEGVEAIAIIIDSIVQVGKGRDC